MKKIDFQRTTKYFYLKFIRLKGDPAMLARGVAVGIFIGVTPTIPFHTIFAIALAFLLRGSKIAALLTTIATSNPLTFFFQYYFSWKIGCILTGIDLSWGKIQDTMTVVISDTGFSASLDAIRCLGQDAVIVMLLGGCILALPFTAAGYFLAHRFFTTVQKRRLKKSNQAGADNAS